MLIDLYSYAMPERKNGAIHFTLALQDGTRQPWVVKDTIANWNFAVWVYIHDRPSIVNND